MKLKKIVLAAFVIMAVSLVMTGCPMTAKDYQKEKAAEQQRLYDQGRYYAIERLVSDSIVSKLRGSSYYGGTSTPSDVTKDDIVKMVDTYNADNELTLNQKHYGVQKKTIVYEGGDLKTATYNDRTKYKNSSDAVKEIVKLFKLK